MQLAAQHLWTAEEDTRLGGRVNLPDAAKDHVPVGTAEVCRGAEAGDGVGVVGGFAQHDIVGVVGFDLGGQVLEENPEF
jgi:hypothetical protein